MLHRTRLLISTLIIGGFIATAMPVQAFDRDDRCEQRIREAERDLHKAERRHGEHSPQADRKRHKLEEIRERCHHDRR